MKNVYTLVMSEGKKYAGVFHEALQIEANRTAKQNKMLLLGDERIGNIPIQSIMNC